MNNVVYAPTRPKTTIQMKFVYGFLQPWAEPDWFAVVDLYSAPLVEIYQMVMMGRMFHRSAGHIQSDSNATRILLKALETNTMQHSLHRLNGAYIQRTGGYCFKLHKVIKEKTVEIERWGLYPEETLRNAWPKTHQDADGMFKTARFPQWPNGTHYYAHLADGEQVEWEGKQKWDTLEESQTATLAYIEDKVSKQTKE